MATTKAKTEHHCACCGRRLKPLQWIYSKHTGARYCWPGTGCNR